jgi:hypothetical protein
MNRLKFTTIRSWNQQKEEYYRSHIGEKFTALYYEKPFQYKNGRLICHVWLYDIQVLAPAQLPLILLRKDITLGGAVQQDWFDKIIKMPRALLLTFGKSPMVLQKRLEVTK